MTDPADRPAPKRVLVDGAWHYQHECANPACNVTFVSRRADARTHSTACRMAVYRARLAGGN